MNNKDKAHADMRREFVKQGFMGAYLQRLRAEQPEAADSLEADLEELFSTDQGLRVLKLFEKAVVFYAFPPGENDCALRELNAVQHFVLEIRRFVANGRRR